MKLKKVSIVLLLALTMICTLFVLACDMKTCPGDGDCYFDRDGSTKGCSEKDCIGNQPKALFSTNEVRKNCNCGDL